MSKQLRSVAIICFVATVFAVCAIVLLPHLTVSAPEEITQHDTQEPTQPLCVETTASYYVGGYEPTFSADWYPDKPDPVLEQVSRGQLALHDVYEYCYFEASPEQKKQLDEISKGAIREILVIMNELPADTGRITLEQAKEICKKLEDQNLTGSIMYAAYVMFNQYAGAPDAYGGSGMTRLTYYVNDEKTVFITIDEVEIYYGNNETDTSEVIFLMGKDLYP